jgi:hypothetical protein
MPLFFLILLIAPLLQWWLPWWAVLPYCLLCGTFLGKNAWRSFWAGMLGVGLGWVALQLFADWRNDFLLAGRMAQLFNLPVWWLLPVISMLLGGLPAGLATAAGTKLRQWLLLREPERFPIPLRRPNR